MHVRPSALIDRGSPSTKNYMHFALMAAMVASNPSYGRLGPAAEAMWEFPSHSQEPAGIFAVFHGCAHSGTDFFAPTPSCSSCLALPEEVKITKAALAKGHAVLAISSTDRHHSRCWNFEVDGPMVRDAIATFRTKHSLTDEVKTPLIVLGASSGGAFALMLPALIPKIKAVVSQIMGIPPSMLPEPAPPTLFVHMPRDQRTASMVQKCMRKLRQGGVATAEIAVPPAKPTAGFFLQRIERLAPAAAIQLHGALKRAGLLDADGYLADDPRRTEWREVLRADAKLMAQLPGPSPNGPSDTLRADESAVSEALNVAWAMHEIVSDQIEATLRWVRDPTSTVEQASRPAAPPHRGGGSLRHETELRMA